MCQASKTPQFHRSFHRRGRETRSEAPLGRSLGGATAPHKHVKAITDVTERHACNLVFLNQETAKTRCKREFRNTYTDGEDDAPMPDAPPEPGHLRRLHARCRTWSAASLCASYTALATLSLFKKSTTIIIPHRLSVVYVSVVPCVLPWHPDSNKPFFSLRWPVISAQCFTQSLVATRDVFKLSPVCPRAA